MTKPPLAGPITRMYGKAYPTCVEYPTFLRGQSQRPKLSALTAFPFELVISQEGWA
jgi:hypothetical protein